MKPTGSFFITIVALFYSSIASAQTGENDTSFVAISVNNAINIYHQVVNKASGLYNGAEYENYPFHFTEGSPYFGVKDSVAGSIFYDGILYKNIFMKYDELKDVVIIWYNNDAMQLLNEKVSSFKFQDHSFIKLIKDNHAKELMGTGFYEQLYAGKIAAFKKVTKTILERPDINDGVERSIDQKTFFYLRTNNGYNLINSKSDLLEVLKDHKNEIKKFIGSQNLNFKKNPAGCLAQVAAYYDTL